MAESVSTEPVVLLAADGPVATITLNRPHARNAISSELLVRLGEAMAAVEAGDEICAAILTGADPAFCAGVDLKELGRETSVLPGWGLSVLLPLAVGRSRARQMSFTGDFLSASQALSAGLVSEVVPHADLLGRAREIAGAIAGNDARAVRALLASYRRVEAEAVAGGFAAEEQAARAWGRSGLDLEETGRRRAAVTERGRSQAPRPEP
jgi:enoyl-CoA hydratase